ncbi:MAG: hypothetical protein JSW00_15690 [Thermoplasmata archaeon]|nr:MAG: hypothetical protein JSW00_15690 [Thermoplasmata archaeon]
MRKIRKLTCVWVAVLLLLTSILVVGGTALGDKEKVRNKHIYTDKGTTDKYGGGDYYMIAFGSEEGGMDAAFGVIWGTKDNPNSIIPFVIQARYLGVAQVYDDDGELKEKNFPIKVYTFYGMKLETMLEFNDTNGDGIFNFKRNKDPDYWWDLWDYEPLCNKKIDLATAWTASEVTTSEDKTNQEKTWEFSLTAENLNYEKVWPLWPWDPANEENVLEKLQFTFHLRAKLVEVDNVTVPQYYVTVTDDPDKKDEADAWPILSSERIENLTYNGKKAMYGVKWDHEIQGWDYNPYFTNESLLMEFKAILGNFVPATTTRWFKAQFMNRLGEDGKARYMKQNGEMEKSSADDPEDKGPRKLKANRIDFEGNWSRIGKFTWVSDVTVDGEEKQMYAQVQAGMAFTLKGRWGRLYTGFALQGGLSYPGGDSIYHDPGMEGEMTFEISEKTESDTNLRPLLALCFGALIFVAVVVVMAIIVHQRGKGKKPEGFESTYDRHTPYQNGPQDWSQYYDRKR